MTAAFTTATTTPPKRQCLSSLLKVTIGQRDRRGCQAIHGTPRSLLCQTGTLLPLGKCNNSCVCVCASTHCMCRAAMTLTL